MVKKEKNIINTLQQALQTLEKTTKSPTDYLKEQNEFAKKNRLLLKSLFDHAKTTAGHFECKSLPDEIYVDQQMDEEQIWQQLEMQNDSFWKKCMTETCRLLSLNENKLSLKFKYSHQTKQNDDDEDVDGDDVANGQDSDQLSELDDEDEDNDDDDDDENNQDDSSSDGSDNKNETNNGEGVDFKASKKIFPSIVDDQFFKLSEMEAFLDNEDKKELDRLNGKPIGKDDDDDSSNNIDYFDSLSDIEDSDDEDGEKSSKEKDMMFADFFDTEYQVTETPEQLRQRKREEREAKNRRKEQEMKEDLGLDDSEEENDGSDHDHRSNEGENESDIDDPVEKSEYDLRQQRLKKRIEEMEEKALAEKPWQLKGEITSSTRPKNSLLEEVLEFDSVARPPPLITEETTMCLEDIIKRRIKSKAWDDVERKIKPINDQQDFRKTLVLQQEKSKESLAQIYEKEYLEKVHKLNNIEDASKRDEPKEHVEIRRVMKDLFVKLDALSNFHFTSKPVAAEAKIITNIPAIEMEEVAPVAISAHSLLAPEEIRSRPIGDEIGKTERTASDKKRERRSKKLKQKLDKKQNDKRIQEKEKLGIKVTSKEKQQQLLNQVTKNRNVTKSKNTTHDENKALKSSKTFFTQLQDNVLTIKSKSKTNEKKRSALDQESSAKRFKL